ncbi:MAG: HAD family hydrolase [Halobacteriota archaeon]
MNYDAYDAIVYDLDGTLVHLDVDWNAVAADVIDVYEAAGIDADGGDLWDLLGRSTEHGLFEAVESTISDHERTGAQTSRRLPLADDVPRVDAPIGVCSLNCADACRIALRTHSIRSAVDAIVGRDTVPTQKPDPAPLLETVDRLGVKPADAVFIGDSPRDELTADRAGVAFEYAGVNRTD